MQFFSEWKNIYHFQVRRKIIVDRKITESLKYLVNQKTNSNWSTWISRRRSDFGWSLIFEVLQDYSHLCIFDSFKKNENAYANGHGHGLMADIDIEFESCGIQWFSQLSLVSRITSGSQTLFFQESLLLLQCQTVLLLPLSSVYNVRPGLTRRTEKLGQVVHSWGSNKNSKFTWITVALQNG